MFDLYKGFPVNAEVFWRPAYRISPFNTSYMAKNYRLIQHGSADRRLIESFLGAEFDFCESGKHAINLALRHFALQPEDEIWIETTSNNVYISSCVTKEIEKFCKWSRTKSSKTKAIFVNHEFGFCYRELASLKKYGLPIIEDKALSFYSFDKENNVGNVGDFVIYSLPKFFPINFGGILKYNPSFSLRVSHKELNKDKEDYLTIFLSSYIKKVEEIKDRRLYNFHYLESLFTTLGMQPRFKPEAKEVPGVFMFTTREVDLAGLKVFMQNNGVESSVFYGEEAFFVPVHQELQREDLDFFFYLVNYFLEYGNKQHKSWQECKGGSYQ